MAFLALACKQEQAAFGGTQVRQAQVRAEQMLLTVARQQARVLGVLRGSRAARAFRALPLVLLLRTMAHRAHQLLKMKQHISSLLWAIR